jgi:hypothetical protein
MRQLVGLILVAGTIAGTGAQAFESSRDFYVTFPQTVQTQNLVTYLNRILNATNKLEVTEHHSDGWYLIRHCRASFNGFQYVQFPSSGLGVWGTLTCHDSSHEPTYSEMVQLINENFAKAAGLDIRAVEVSPGSVSGSNGKHGKH